MVGNCAALLEGQLAQRDGLKASLEASSGWRAKQKVYNKVAGGPEGSLFRERKGSSPLEASLKPFSKPPSS